MIRSMTGYGAADGPAGTARAWVEIRSVNHRFFSPGIKLPAALARWEPEVREYLRGRFARGHLTLTVRLERPDQPGAVIDEVAFAAHAAALIGLQRRTGLGGVVDVAAVLRMPDVVRAPSGDEESEGGVDELLAIVRRAADGLAAAREAEGARLADVIRARLEVLEATLRRIALRAPERVSSHRDRLRENVRTLLDGRAPDEQRLAQEIALLAERLDTGEEVDRFGMHLAAVRETLAAAPEGGVGKRVGFLLQELLREANTIGSKANDAVTQADVVALKEELERIREQVENIE